MIVSLPSRHISRIGEENFLVGRWQCIPQGVGGVQPQASFKQAKKTQKNTFIKVAVIPDMT